ncbi:MAG: DUF3261 domain-containing protein [Myxococcales bacterium]|nr:DUF3261 domain-containing protein [Myxococcales bacterium]
MNRTACGLLGLCVVGGLACASPPEPKRISAPGLVPTEQLPGELLARHRFAYRFGEREGALEAVLQVHCGEVVVLGLGPMSSPLFSIRQRGDAIEAWSQRPWPRCAPDLPLPRGGSAPRGRRPRAAGGEGRLRGALGGGPARRARDSGGGCARCPDPLPGGG